MIEFRSGAPAKTRAVSPSQGSVGSRPPLRFVPVPFLHEQKEGFPQRLSHFVSSWCNWWHYFFRRLFHPILPSFSPSEKRISHPQIPFPLLNLPPSQIRPQIGKQFHLRRLLASQRKTFSRRTPFSSLRTLRLGSPLFRSPPQIKTASSFQFSPVPSLSAGRHKENSVVVVLSLFLFRMTPGKRTSPSLSVRL